jgi:zinc/manganese transport system permease protein
VVQCQNLQQRGTAGHRLARFWAQDISNMIVVAVAAALASSLIGLLVSYYANLPSGPAIILTAGAGYLVSVLFGVQGGLLWRLMPRRHLEA